MCSSDAAGQSFLKQAMQRAMPRADYGGHPAAAQWRPACLPACFFACLPVRPTRAYLYPPTLRPSLPTCPLQAS